MLIAGTPNVWEKEHWSIHGVLMATVYAALISGAIYGLFHRLRLGFLVLIFIVLWVGFYLAGNWAAVERPAELDRRFPISSKELRARRKAFYDWLASQGAAKLGSAAVLFGKWRNIPIPLIELEHSNEVIEGTAKSPHHQKPASGSPDAIFQYRLKRSFGFDLCFAINRNQHGLSYLHRRFRIRDEPSPGTYCACDRKEKRTVRD